MIFNRKDFISLKDISKEEINYILSTAEIMKSVLSQKNKTVPFLQGKSVILLFYENSSRTRVSYELAGKYLSASIVDMTIPHYLEDTGGLAGMGKIIDQMGADFIIIRHPMSGSAEFLSKYVSASVINAGDGLNENPSGSLLDLMTIKREKGDFKDLKVVMVGDVKNSRIAHSSIWGLLKLGSKVSVTGPSTLIPLELKNFGVDIYYNPVEAVRDADVIIGLNIKSEESYKNSLPSYSEYKSMFKIDKTILSYAKSDAIVIHPANSIRRDIEISSEIIESSKCFFNDQISNGVAVRMALLYLLSLRGGE